MSDNSGHAVSWVAVCTYLALPTGDPAVSQTSRLLIGWSSIMRAAVVGALISASKITVIKLWLWRCGPPSVSVMVVRAGVAGRAWAGFASVAPSPNSGERRELD